MDNQSKIILISGPTASGKSNFAIKVAKKINGEIINVDSMQVYKQLKILTARLDKKNQNQCEWAWNYLVSDYSLNTGYINPFLPLEAHSAVIACLDHWSPYSPAEKELFLIKMKKSWGQKKHRDKQVDRKSYNFVLNVNTKEKLDKLAIKHDKKKNEMIEFLINNEFNKLE